MRKNETIGIRVPAELKKALIQIAKKEGRSLAQLCEILLTGATASYKEEDQHFSSVYSRTRRETPPTSFSVIRINNFGMRQEGEPTSSFNFGLTNLVHDRLKFCLSLAELSELIPGVRLKTPVRELFV